MRINMKPNVINICKISSKVAKRFSRLEIFKVLNHLEINGMLNI